MDILGTGLTGMVGSRVVELLNSSYTFENLSLESGVDITNLTNLDKRFAASSAPWVFHFAAYTDVQGAEKEKDLREQSTAWKVNVGGTENIVACCKKYGKHLIYISTDYVFDGTKDEYNEDDIPNPLSFYTETKFHGEEAVKTLGKLGAIVRIGNPYRANPKVVTPATKLDVVHRIRNRLAQGLSVTAPTDQVFTCTFIDDLALAMDAIVKHTASGIFHVPSREPIVTYDMMLLIAKIFGFDEQLIQKTTYTEFFKGRAAIPQKAALRHGRIDALGVHLHSVEEGLNEVKKQETV